ncbi:MAG: VWA domain-containing protein [Gammaproteobacteria bacterium]|nr:VWA domain-containing protein [Gammaproteobacteria bacterium]
MHIKILLLICIVAGNTFFSNATAGDSAKHIRVVLDISKSLSMKRPSRGWPTDSGRLAILSTILLYDLTNPNFNYDTFKVIPFDENWKWDPGAPPPESKRPFLEIKQSKSRGVFVQILNSLAYNGNKTYFYPGLIRAAEDLKSAGGGKHAIKTIILITDGLPENEIRQQEKELIREQLVPLLEHNKIRLYILAFGKEAFKNQIFFEAMLASADKMARLGEFLVDEDGSELLYNMIRIFSYNFGFVTEAPQPLPKTKYIDLDGGFTPVRVGVVVFSKRRMWKAPRLSLTPPSKGTLNKAGKLQSARETGGGYSLLWVLSPNKGIHRLKTNISKGSVAMLRPGHVNLEVRPSPPQTARTDLAMVGKPIPLKILVKSPSGAQGDPGQTELTYRLVAKGISEPLTKKRAPPPNSGIITREGREYDIMVEFPAHPQLPEKNYDAYIEIQAYRGGKVLVGSFVHPIHVKASGVFHYTGGPVSVDLGALGAASAKCSPLTFKNKPHHLGEVDFELEGLKILPLGHDLKIWVSSDKILEPDKGALSIKPNDSFEVCLTTEDWIGSSAAAGEEWLELRKKGSDGPDQRIRIRLHWNVQGLTFWQRWGWLILWLIAILTILFLIAGILLPQRFPNTFAVVFVPEREELEEHFPLPVNQWKGVHIGFFRNARAFLHADYRLSGKAQGALACLYAEKGGCRAASGKGGALYRETLDGDWENVAQEGRRARPGDIFRISERGPYFRISVRGG